MKKVSRDFIRKVNDAITEYNNENMTPEVFGHIFKNLAGMGIDVDTMKESGRSVYKFKMYGEEVENSRLAVTTYRLGDGLNRFSVCFEYDD